MEKVAFDTSICIAMFKDATFTISFTKKFSGKKAYVPSVAVFELLLRKHSLNIVDDFLNHTELLNFDEHAARKAAEITKELRNAGTPIETNDVFIAATAMANNCELATLNTKDFSKIKGLKLVKLH